MEITPIAKYNGPLQSKFGLPRQSSLVCGLQGTVTFEPAFRDPSALKGLEGFGRIWLIWEFSACDGSPAFRPLVRPPRLGGNRSVGVWASRSPFRPNRLGLSCVKMEGIETDGPDGPLIRVSGADLMDGTPIYDIKPYLPYSDAFPDEASGFAAGAPAPSLEVEFNVPSPYSESDTAVLEQLLALDPRPSYQDDPERVYGFPYMGKDVRFRVCGNRLSVIGFA